MYAINAYFHGGSVYLNRRQSLGSNETLVQLLNMDLSWVEELYRELSQFSHDFYLESDMRQGNIEAYDRRATRAQRLIYRLDEVAQQLGIYQKAVSAEFLYTDKLFDCLNQVEWVWLDDTVNDP